MTRNETASLALVAVTNKHKVLVYSLPYLEFMHVAQLPPGAASSVHSPAKWPSASNPIFCRRISIDRTGDFISWTHDGRYGVVEHTIYGTLFGLRRPTALPDIDLQSTRPAIPPQPQPVGAGALEVLGSWFGFSKTLSGEQVDALRTHMLILRGRPSSYSSPSCYQLLDQIDHSPNRRRRQRLLPVKTRRRTSPNRRMPPGATCTTG